MMKNYTITVNGNVYEVTVEEGFTGKASAPRAAAPAPAAPAKAVAPAPAKAPAPAAVPAPAPVPAPAAAPAPTAAPAAGSVTVSAPMPGKILGIKTSVGAAVKRGQVILILEAMKMENEIVAPEDGTVASINVTVGEMVEPGATLATLN